MDEEYNTILEQLSFDDKNHKQMDQYINAFFKMGF